MIPLAERLCRNVAAICPEIALTEAARLIWLIAALLIWLILTKCLSFQTYSLSMNSPLKSLDCSRVRLEEFVEIETFECICSVDPVGRSHSVETILLKRSSQSDSLATSPLKPLSSAILPVIPVATIWSSPASAAVECGRNCVIANYLLRFLSSVKLDFGTN